MSADLRATVRGVLDWPVPLATVVLLVEQVSVHPRHVLVEPVVPLPAQSTRVAHIEQAKLGGQVPEGPPKRRRVPVLPRPLRSEGERVDVAARPDADPAPLGLVPCDGDLRQRSERHVDNDAAVPDLEKPVDANAEELVRSAR